MLPDHCSDQAHSAGPHASASASPHPPPPCTATAPIPAARSAKSDVGESARLSGWCHRIRDHGGVLFIDLRDHYGMTQCVVDPDSPAFKLAETARSEWVIRVDGKVRKRPAGTENPDLPTGDDRALHHRDRGAGSG